MTRARENADLPVAMTESGGQVGIGATSVDQLLHLETSTNTRQKIETTNSGSVAGLQLTNTAITAEIGLETSSDAGGGAYSNSMGGSSLHILNNNNSGIVMDTSGRVTMPQQPRFRVRNSAVVNYTTANSAIGWNTEDFDVGNNFSGSTFTCPVDGLYFFSFNVFANVSHSVNIDILHNGGIIGRAERGAAESYYETFGLSLLFQCSANDSVRLHLNSGQIHTNGPLNFFTGYLVA